MAFAGNACPLILVNRAKTAHRVAQFFSQFSAQSAGQRGLTSRQAGLERGYHSQTRNSGDVLWLAKKSLSLVQA
jgi:hypothetical protein